MHPYTNADPGGWAWTNLPGGVPDADDTPGAILALLQLRPDDSGLPRSASDDPLNVAAHVARGTSVGFDPESRSVRMDNLAL